MNLRPAVAIFVKTPGLSPLKTRLAATIGVHRATEFYRLACDAITETLGSVAGEIDAYWAVAESEATEKGMWEDFPIVWQGDGELGNRLAKVYSELLAKHTAVLLIGADAPQLASTHIQETLKLLKERPYVIGRAQDGGFYLFGGRDPIAANLWTSVTYSCSATSRQLEEKLSPKVAFLQENLGDVDNQAALHELARYLQTVPKNRAQVILLNWCQNLRKS